MAKMFDENLFLKNLRYLTKHYALFKQTVSKTSEKSDP